MLLTPAVVLTGLGFASWVAGVLADYRGLAALGAVLVVGVGGMVLTDGLEREAGSIEKSVTNSTTGVTTTETVPQTTSIDLLPQTPTGAVWMLIGGTMLLQGINPND